MLKSTAQNLQADALTSCRHDFVISLLFFVILLLVTFLSFAVGSLLQLGFLVDGACDRMFLRVHLQRVLIVRNLNNMTSS